MRAPATKPCATSANGFCNFCLIVIAVSRSCRPPSVTPHMRIVCLTAPKPEVNRDRAPLDEGVRPDDEGASGVPMAPIQSICSRSEEHTSELQSLMRISYAVFCLKKKKIH